MSQWNHDTWCDVVTLGVTWWHLVWRHDTSCVRHDLVPLIWDFELVRDAGRWNAIKISSLQNVNIMRNLEILSEINWFNPWSKMMSRYIISNRLLWTIEGFIWDHFYFLFCWYQLLIQANGMFWFCKFNFYFEDNIFVRLIMCVIFVLLFILYVCFGEPIPNFNIWFLTS